jgi:DNA polymerase III epsilon subunit-like protein
MIVIDAETTGIDPQLHCLASLGAVDYDTGAEFYGECRIWEESLIDPTALGINGFTETQLRDPTKPSPSELYAQFLAWCRPFGTKLVLAGQQVGTFDVPFLQAAQVRGSFDWPFSYRTIDLHSIAYAVYRESLGTNEILRLLGHAGEVEPHHALVGAKLERSSLRQLLEQLVTINSL